MDAMPNFSLSSSHRIQTRDLDDVNITFPDVRACNGPGVVFQAGKYKTLFNETVIMWFTMPGEPGK